MKKAVYYLLLNSKIFTSTKKKPFRRFSLKVVIAISISDSMNIQAINLKDISLLSQIIISSPTIRLLVVALDELRHLKACLPDSSLQQNGPPFTECLVHLLHQTYEPHGILLNRGTPHPSFDIFIVRAKDQKQCLWVPVVLKPRALSAFTAIACDRIFQAQPVWFNC